MNTRNNLFDNVKALMLLLVAVGHALELYMGSDQILLVVMKYIYLFHMPMFAFVTGYFTKNLDKAREGAVTRALTPYLILQTAYVLVAQLMITIGLASFNTDIFKPSVILPSSAFYYLLAVFFWKLLGKDFMRMRFPIAMATILGVCFSLTSSQEFHEGYGSVFTLLIFFVLGVKCTQEHIEKIRKMPKIASVAILLLGILPAVYLPYEIHSIRMNYESVGFSPIEGILYRLAFYAIAVVMCIAIINLMTAKKTFFSRVGESAIVVYGVSTFLSPHGYLLLDKIFNIPDNTWVRLISIIIFSAVVVGLGAVPLFVKIFNWLVSFVNGILFRKETGK